MCYCGRVGSAWRFLMADPCKTRCWVSPTWEFHTGTLLTGTVCSLHFILPSFVLVLTKMLYNLFSRAAVTRLRKVSIHSWPFRDVSAHLLKAALQYRMLLNASPLLNPSEIVIYWSIWWGSNLRYGFIKGCESISWVFRSQTCQQFCCGFKQSTLCILFTY